jgi:ABC-type bacteriocin/lantibiotic exporter with double-glycine peptidase domain
MAKRNRYQEMEQLLTVALIADAVIFVLYLIVAGAAIGWLKIVLAVVALLMAAAGLAFLFLTRELLKQRSLWLSCGFFSVFLCTLVSLILAYPG